MTLTIDYSMPASGELASAITVASAGGAPAAGLFRWRRLSPPFSSPLLDALFESADPDRAAVESAIADALEVFILDPSELARAAALAIAADFCDALDAARRAGLVLGLQHLKAAADADAMRCTALLVQRKVLPPAAGLGHAGPVAPAWVSAARPELRDLILQSMLERELAALATKSRRAKADDDEAPPSRPSCAPEQLP
jgi:hypothetical protein